MKDAKRTKGEEEYCKFTLIENAVPVTRRIHELVIQDEVGKIHRVSGDKLPSSMTAITGDSQTDHHTLEILISPRKLRRIAEQRSDGYRWPVGRDVLHVAIGFAGLQLLKATFFGIDAFLGTLVGAFYEALSH